MKNIIYALIAAFFCLPGLNLYAQETGHSMHPTLITRSDNVIEVPSIASQIAAGTFIPAEDRATEFNPKHWGSNTSVPGKGLPVGNDPLVQKQEEVTKTRGRTPILSFDAASATATPTDPTGAVGPNHFVNSWNSSFRIWDKAGNPLIAAASLGTLLPGTMGDPIVIYDPFADRFLITEFFSNGFDVAISKGPNPVTSGWWVYRFPTNTFPDYPKFTVWSDGYYITSNKDQNTASTSQVVFALERDKMLIGNTSALMIGFPLTGIVTSGFYSPLGFNANGPTPPPPGNAPIVYMQDDAWTGVTVDHLKIWSVNVNWTTPASSTISSPQIINTAPFDGLFDGGSFSNLPQPSGSDIDALQATIMFMAQYRRFPTYNTVVFNFVVDLDGNDNKAGIRWYELRQTVDGAPWTIYQEGTYAQPNGHSAFSGNMCMDMYGNIGLAYTVVSTTQNPSLRFTGRYASDPLGTMTIAEDVIINGTSVDPSSRYGDYSQMTVDPVDGRSLWSIGEYFSGGRKNRVGVFQIAPPTLTAMFSGTPTTVCTGSTVVFTDQSLASPTSWTWSFPGGTPSTYSGQTPPSITYNTAGTYDVSLTVSDGVTTDTETKTNYITVKNVISNFTGTPTNVIIGNSVTFTDNSSCSPTSWTWSFPGGTPSTFNGQTPPAITYSALGTYDVTLTVTKPGGTDTKTKVGYITVSPPVFNMTNGTITTCSGDFYDSGGPTGNYQNNENITETFYPSTPGSLLRFTFTSFSTESGYDYLKIYNGVNTTAPLIGTYHGTTGPGVVTATNAAGALTFNFTSDVSGTPAGWAATISCYSITAPPVADFSASSVNPLVAQTVTFTDLSTNIPTSWLWSFSPATVTYVNGTSATSQNPQVQFPAVGQYSVTLTATNGYGADSETKTNYIYVTNCTYNVLPFAEGFESLPSTPTCWSEENSSPAWQYITGNGSSHPATAHGGTRNACLKDATSADNKNKLITPIFDFTQYTNIVLTFWHTQEVWSTDQDQLSVYYRTSAGGTWTLLQSYTASVVTWTQRTITLPSTGSYYQVAFEGNARYGYGVCIDDISITGTSTGPFITVTPPNQNVTTAAGSTPFTVSSNASWTATSNQGWCTIPTPSGTGNGTLTVNYAQNTNPGGRVANINVAVTGLPDAVVTVTQAGTAVPTLAVTPPNQNVTAPAGTTPFTVTSNAAWTVLSDQTWCTVTPSGTGNGTITATYSENLLTTPRVANIRVEVIGLTPVFVTVTQAGAAPILAVTPPNQNVTPPGGFVTFNVTSNLTWTITSNAGWCVPSPANGSGTGTFDVVYEENTSTSTRIATLLITASGLTPIPVTVTQAGVAPMLSVAPPNQDVPVSAGQTNFTVTSNSSWTVTSDQTWCTATPSGTGTGTIIATYEANPSQSPRQATIAVSVTGTAPVNVTVTQEGLVGMPEIQEGNFILYPNPNDGRFSISSIDHRILVMTVKITEIHGKEIRTIECKGKEHYSIDLSDQAKGSYLVRITTGKSTVVRKIIVE